MAVYPLVRDTKPGRSRIHVVRPRHLDRGATVDDHDSARVGRRHCAHQSILVTRQPQRGPVLSFGLPTAVCADDNQRHVGCSSCVEAAAVKARPRWVVVGDHHHQS